MTAFDTAWDLVKMFSLNWRGAAKQLPLLGGEDQPPLTETDEGSNAKVYQHPFDDRFVVKRPFDANFDPDYPNSSAEGRTANDDFYAFMERLGYPIVGEQLAIGHHGQAYTIQPRLIDGESKDAKDSPIPTKRALMYAFGDLENPFNYMKDQLGNYRVMDLDPERYAGYGAWFNEYDKRGNLKKPHHTQHFGGDGRPAGQWFQEWLDRKGIQLPASRMLNEMDRVDYPDFHYRGALEALEPFSDNPNKVLVEGKPKWMEGLE